MVGVTRAWLLAIVTACWTGPVPDPVAPDQPAPRTPHRDVDLEIKLRRTACFGRCPVFDVSISHDGTLRYVGRQNVAEVGERSRKLTRGQMVVLARAVDHVHFFELDDQGHEPVDQGCRTIGTPQGGTTTTCSFKSFSLCSDTSHTIVTVSRPRQGGTHTIDDAHCAEDGGAADLERRVEELVAPWVSH
jgi:hypothetical protein